MAELNIKLRIDGKEVEARLLEADRLLKQAKYEATGVGDTIAKWGMAVTGFNQGLDAINRVYSTLSKPLDAAGQFEQFEATLKVMLGTADAAKQRMQEYVELAKLTPFELPEVVAVGNQLQAIGKYSKETLIMLSDLASASKKPIEQVMAAYAKMMTGQKGIAIDMFRDMLISADDWAKATGKKIGKNGELQASVEEMAAALPKIMKEKAFEGMSAEQAKTYKGMASNTADALGQLTVDVGDKILPLAKQVLDIMTSAINTTRDNLDKILPLLKLIATATASYMVATYGLATAQNVLTVAMVRLKSAYETVALTMMYNPFGVAVAGLSLLFVGLSEARKAAQEYNREMMVMIDQNKKFIDANKDLSEAQLEQRIIVLNAIKTGLEGLQKQGPLGFEDTIKLKQTNDELFRLNALLLAIRNPQGIEPGKSNTTSDDAFEKKTKEEREKILQERRLAELEKAAKKTEYRDLQEQIASKEDELNKINNQLLSKNLSKERFEQLKNEQDLAKKSLDVLKDVAKDKEQEGDRQFEDWRKKRDKQTEIEDQIHQKEKEKADQRRQQSRDLARMQAENEPDEFQRRRLEAENEMKDALDDVNRDTVMTDETKAAMRIAIYQRYANKIKDIDRDLLQSQIDNAQQLVNELANGFNAIYGMVQNNANKEISQWKKKESDKLEEEHKAALKRARTDRDRERIDKEYANKKDAIETEAQRKATERLKTWFEMQKAASIAQATISTYQAAAGQLKAEPVGFWNIALAAAIIAAGLANVAVIASQKFEAAGYDQGGRLKKGNVGFFEGNRDEIIAPEETFIEVMNRDLIPRLTRDNMTLGDLKDANSLMMLRSILSVNRALDNAQVKVMNNDSQMINELRSGFNDLKNAFSKIKFIVGRRTAKDIVITGNEELRKSR